MLRRGPQPARAREHDADHRQSDQQLAQDGSIQTPVRPALQWARHIAQDFGQGGQQQGADDHARDVPDATQHHHGHDHHRLLQRERLRRYKALKAREHHARYTSERGPHAKSQKLHVAGVDAHGLGGNFVFANSHPGPPDAAALQAVANQHAEHHQHQKQVVIVADAGHFKAEEFVLLAQIKPDEGDLHRIDLREALGAIGDVDGRIKVVQKHPDDFAKTQGNDGQIVAPQFQCGRAQQNAGKARQCGAQRYHPQQGRVHAARKDSGNPFKRIGELRAGQQAKHIGAHGIKRHIAKV